MHGATFQEEGESLACGRLAGTAATSFPRQYWSADDMAHSMCYIEVVALWWSCKGPLQRHSLRNRHALFLELLYNIPTLWVLQPVCTAQTCQLRRWTIVMGKDFPSTQVYRRAAGWAFTTGQPPDYWVFHQRWLWTDMGELWMVADGSSTRLPRLGEQISRHVV